MSTVIDGYQNLLTPLFISDTFNNVVTKLRNYASPLNITASHKNDVLQLLNQIKSYGEIEALKIIVNRLCKIEPTSSTSKLYRIKWYAINQLAWRLQRAPSEEPELVLPLLEILSAIDPRILTNYLKINVELGNNVLQHMLIHTPDAARALLQLIGTFESHIRAPILNQNNRQGQNALAIAQQKDEELARILLSLTEENYTKNSSNDDDTLDFTQQHRLRNRSLIYNIDSACSKTESFLTKYAAIPILGTIPAIIKIALASVQVTLATLSLAASAVFTINTQIGRDVFIHSARHLAHGLINILTGAIEAIPVIGSCLFCATYIRQNVGSDASTKHESSQAYKFFGYKTLDTMGPWTKKGYSDYPYKSEISQQEFFNDSHGFIEAPRYLI